MEHPYWLPLVFSKGLSSTSPAEKGQQPNPWLLKPLPCTNWWAIPGVRIICPAVCWDWGVWANTLGVHTHESVLYLRTQAHNWSSQQKTNLYVLCLCNIMQIWYNQLGFPVKISSHFNNNKKQWVCKSCCWRSLVSRIHKCQFSPHCKCSVL